MFWRFFSSIYIFQSLWCKLIKSAHNVHWLWTTSSNRQRQVWSWKTKIKHWKSCTAPPPPPLARTFRNKTTQWKIQVSFRDVSDNLQQFKNFKVVALPPRKIAISTFVDVSDHFEHFFQKLTLAVIGCSKCMQKSSEFLALVTNTLDEYMVVVVMMYRYSQFHTSNERS